MHATTSTERTSDPTEHRWGQRVTLEVPVRIEVGGRKMGRGVLRNVSISGALIETALELPVFSNLVVSIPEVGNLDASIVRCTVGGFAVEWRDMACNSLAALLNRVTGQSVATLIEDTAFTHRSVPNGRADVSSPGCDEVQESFEAIDTNASGSIEFDDFRALMLKLDHSYPEGALRDRFAALDTNGDGRISKQEFRVWLESGGR